MLDGSASGAGWGLLVALARHVPREATRNRADQERHQALRPAPRIVVVGESHDGKPGHQHRGSNGNHEDETHIALPTALIVVLLGFFDLGFRPEPLEQVFPLLRRNPQLVLAPFSGEVMRPRALALLKGADDAFESAVGRFAVGWFRRAFALDHRTTVVFGVGISGKVPALMLTIMASTSSLPEKPSP